MEPQEDLVNQEGQGNLDKVDFKEGGLEVVMTSGMIRLAVIHMAMATQTNLTNK